MPKSSKSSRGFSQATTLILMSLIAITSFIVAQRIGRETQELRMRAQAYPSPTPLCKNIGTLCIDNPYGCCPGLVCNQYCQYPASPVPTPTPKPSPSPSLKPSPSPTPKPTPSSTPKVSPSPTLKPSPTPLTDIFSVDDYQKCYDLEACPWGAWKTENIKENKLCLKRDKYAESTGIWYCCVGFDHHYNYNHLHDEGRCPVFPSPKSSPAPRYCTPANKLSNEGFPCCPGLEKNRLSPDWYICLTPKPITSTITSSLSCDEYNNIIGRQCAYGKVDEIYKGLIACPNSPSKNIFCRLYCSVDSYVTEDYCNWIPDNAVETSVTYINDKPITWDYCPLSYQEAYTKIIESVPEIFPRNDNHDLEIMCYDFGGYSEVLGQANSSGLITLWCNPDLELKKEIQPTRGGYTCEKTLYHELIHEMQFQENIFNSDSYSASNNDFNKHVGCWYDPAKKIYNFIFEDPITVYGKTNCTEMFAEAGIYYISPDLACYMKQNFPIQYGFFYDHIFYGREFCTNTL